MISIRTLLGLVAVVGGGAVAVLITGTVLAQAGAPPRRTVATVSGTADTTQGSLPHAFLKLASYPDSMGGPHGTDGGTHPDWVTYGPTSSLEVPAHSLVTVTIDQYDTGGSLNNPYFATPWGTVGGAITVDGKTVRRTDPDAIGHTFTIHALPTDQDPLYVSVPLPAVSDDAPAAPGSDYAAPHVVTFSFITGGRGHYIWNCEFPCGDGYYARFGGPMATQGYMSGSFDVT